MSAADLQARLRDVDEQNALIVRRQAADRLDLYEATIVDSRQRRDELEAELAELAYWKEEAELKVERLTVGRATLEDQTNRAELAGAQVKALEQEALQFGGNVWKARAEALEAALYECRQQRDEHYEAGRTLWLASKDKCICSEIDARHCPVHNEVLSGGSE